MNYKVETDDFKGPLEKLLELVKDEELDINQISLAKVTKDFLVYLEELREKDVPHKIVADFLVVASKLLLIKSKVIIPSLDFDEDEQEDMEQLELQLKLYEKIKGAKENLEKSWAQKPAMASRKFLMTKETFFHPPRNADADRLLKAMKSVENEIEKFKPVEKVERKMVSLESKIKDVLTNITEKASSINNLKNNGTKGEVVVLFLAVLHLFKDQEIDVNQHQNFGDINVAKK